MERANIYRVCFRITKFVILLQLILSCNILSAQNSYKDIVFTEYFRRPGPGWVASDATISIPLPNGKVLWLMGDTNLDDYSPADTTMPCLFHVRNSILVQDAVDRNKMITILDSTKKGVERTPVKIKTNDTTLFWPGHGFVKGDTVYTYWARYHSTSLRYLGMYLSKIHWPSLKNASSIKPPVALANTSDTEYGNSVLVNEDSSYVYLYGHRKNTFINDLYVARVPYNNVYAPWEFYNGSAWVSNASQAQKIMPNGYVAPSFSIIKAAGKYYLINQEIGFLTCGYGRRIFSYVSSSPYGPFTNRQTIYIIRDKYRGGYLITYNTTAHPEFTKNNEILISYNVNNTCPNLSQCKNAWTDRYNADLYRPKFVRVPIAVLDTGIFLKPEPEFIVTQTPGSLTVNFDASKSVARGDITSYTWSFGDGSRDTTTSLFVKSISHRYNAPGVYNARVTISDGKESSSATAVINLTTTSLEVRKDPGVSIFPNPAKGKFIVKLDRFNINENALLIVTNSVGQSVYEESIKDSETTVDLESDGGIYFVHIIRGSDKRNYKLILLSND